MAKSTKNEVAVKDAGAIAPFAMDQLPDYLKQGPARGNEEVKSSDMVLPRLELVQAQSPIKDTNDEAREGMLFNSVTQELYGDYAYFVPVYYRMEYLIWQNADEGGGFHGAYPSEDAARVAMKRIQEDDPKLIGDGKNGKPMLEVVDTPIHYGLRVEPEGTSEQIVISMPKTKAKVSRRWNSMIQIAGGDRFGRVYKISSFTDENKQGKKFKNFVVQPAGFPPKAVYEQAELLYEAFRSGAMAVNHGSVIEEEGAAPADGIDRGGI